MMFDMIPYGDIGPAEHMAQWDTGMSVTVPKSAFPFEVSSGSLPAAHFANAASEYAYVVETSLEGGAVSAPVPNELLKQPLTIYLYFFEGGATRLSVEIPVMPRKRPEDLVYSDDPVVFRIEELEDEVEAWLVQLSAQAQGHMENLNAAAQKSIENINNIANQNIGNINNVASGHIANIDNVARTSIENINNAANVNIQNINDVANTDIGNVNSVANTNIENIKKLAEDSIKNINNAANADISAVNDAAGKAMEEIRNYASGFSAGAFESRISGLEFFKQQCTNDGSPVASALALCNGTFHQNLGQVMAGTVSSSTYPSAYTWSSYYLPFIRSAGAILASGSAGSEFGRGIASNHDFLNATTFDGGNISNSGVFSKYQSDLASFLSLSPESVKKFDYNFKYRLAYDRDFTKYLAHTMTREDMLGKALVSQLREGEPLFSHSDSGIAEALAYGSNFGMWLAKNTVFISNLFSNSAFLSAFSAAAAASCEEAALDTLLDIRSRDFSAASEAVLDATGTVAPYVTEIKFYTGGKNGKDARSISVTPPEEWRGQKAHIRLAMKKFNAKVTDNLLDISHAQDGTNYGITMKVDKEAGTYTLSGKYEGTATADVADEMPQAASDIMPMSKSPNMFLYGKYAYSEPLITLPPGTYYIQDCHVFSYSAPNAPVKSIGEGKVTLTEETLVNCIVCSPVDENKTYNNEVFHPAIWKGSKAKYWAKKDAVETWTRLELEAYLDGANEALTSEIVVKDDVKEIRHEGEPLLVDDGLNCTLLTR